MAKPTHKTQRATRKAIYIPDLPEPDSKEYWQREATLNLERLERFEASRTELIEKARGLINENTRLKQQREFLLNAIRNLGTALADVYLESDVADAPPVAVP